MKTLFLIIAIMFTGMVASAQDFEPTQIAIKPWGIMNADSQAVVVMPEAVGLVGKSVFIAVNTFENKESAYVGQSDDSGFKGICVAESGELVFINASKVIILRPKFASHADADASLINGQEYYLNGDRVVYRKP